MENYTSCGKFFPFFGKYLITVLISFMKGNVFLRVEQLHQRNRNQNTFCRTNNDWFSQQCEHFTLLRLRKILFDFHLSLWIKATRTISPKHPGRINGVSAQWSEYFYNFQDFCCQPVKRQWRSGCVRLKIHAHDARKCIINGKVNGQCNIINSFSPSASIPSLFINLMSTRFFSETGKQSETRVSKQKRRVLMAMSSSKLFAQHKKTLWIKKWQTSGHCNPFESI